MKIFLDTADVSTILNHFETGLIDGVTTNPTLIRKSGRDPEDVYLELAEAGVRDISMEVMHERNAHNFPLDLASAETSQVALVAPAVG